MKTIAALLLLAACGTDEPESTSVDCAAFRGADYKRIKPEIRCRIDMTGVDAVNLIGFPSVLAPPGEAVGGEGIGGDFYETSGNTWTGSPADGVAVLLTNGRCQWVECE